MNEDQRPDEDWEPEPDDAGSRASREEVPEADALEQEREVRPASSDDPDHIDPETPEADALEQARDAGGEDDIDERR